ncbi:MAG: carboxypeptidase regulatory-like domain-containing protein [Deltaproteobacteria bacterium]|nr:carboxypeptidase regulatory-like domain-containing protein [Deltaproteobacteria bacterium]
MRRRRAAAAAIALGGIALFAHLAHRPTSSPGPSGAGGDEAAGSRRAGDPRLSEAIGRLRTARTGAFAAGAADLDGAVVVSGTVIDARTHGPVAGVEVVLRSAIFGAEETTIAGADGTYRIAVAPGVYRAFVRDDTVLSVGRAERVRLPGPPSADAAGVPDEALMPLLVANADAGGHDLTVTRGGIVTGRVLDRSGNPIAGAAVRARTNTGTRPALGTDLAESDASGRYELRLPEGEYAIDATHARFAGADARADRVVLVEAARRIARDVTMTAGCVIAGRVVGPAGRARVDGAIERRWGTTDLEFSPSSRIEADGTFRWVTAEPGEVTLRAWPWKSAPSEAQTFTCVDGARFTTTFAVPDRRPDIAGTLVDAAGAAVADAYVDLMPLDPGGIGQQERTDADGSWGVFHMPAGRYRISVHAPGRGVVTAIVTSPQADVRLALGGVGRLEGTVSRLDSGSFELELRTCTSPAGGVALPGERRVVSVAHGKFTVDDVPACGRLELAATWRGHTFGKLVDVTAGAATQLELALGPPARKLVRGVVRRDGRPVAGANIVATFEGDDARTTTDAAGRYTIRTYTDALVVATHAGASAAQELGGAAGDEVLDLDLAPMEADAHDGPDVHDGPGWPEEDLEH